MKIISTPLNSNPNVNLAGYILNSSEELANADVRPAVLIFPGGGYRVCSDREAEPVAMAYVAQGFNAFILTYSLNENAAFPKPLKDAEAALEFIRNNSAEWGINPEKIAVCGFSAGGHLAAALGTMGKQRPNALILGYPCILASIGEILPAPIPSCDECVDDKTPPTFIFHTFEDELVPVENSLRFSAALDKAKVPFEMHIFQKGCHGLSLAKDLTSSGLQRFVNPDVEKWFDLSVCWLHNLFGKFDSSALYFEAATGNEIREYSVDVVLGRVWTNPACKQIILEYIPGFDQYPHFNAALSVSLRQISGYSPELFSEEQLSELDRRLKAVTFMDLA